MSRPQPQPLGEDEYNETLRVLRTLTVALLKDVSRSLGLAVSGRKADLADRIETFLRSGRSTQDYLRQYVVRIIILRASSGQHVPSYNEVVNSMASAGGTSYNSSYSSSSYASHSSSHSLSQPRKPQAPRPAFKGHQLYFKETPFYKLRRLIQGSPIIAKAAPDNRGTANLRFTLNEKEQEMLATDNNQLFLLSGVIDPKTTATTDAKLYFPQPIEIHFNRTVLKDNVKGIKNRPGTARPANLTPFVRSMPMENTLEVVYAFTKDDFLLYCYIVEPISSDSLFQNIMNKPHIIKQATIKQIEDEHNAEDDDIMEVSTVLDLKCPLTFGRLKNPCKSIYCQHISCFEGLAFLQLQEQVPTWSCPICGNIIDVKDLAISDYILEIIDNTGEDDEVVEIDPDGSWRLKKEDARDPALQNNSNDIYKPKQENENVVVPSAMNESVEVISLDSDTDSEDEQPEVSAAANIIPNNYSVHHHSSSFSDTPLSQIRRVPGVTPDMVRPTTLSNYSDLDNVPLSRLQNNNTSWPHNNIQIAQPPHNNHANNNDILDAFMDTSSDNIRLPQPQVNSNHNTSTILPGISSLVATPANNNPHNRIISRRNSVMERPRLTEIGTDSAITDTEDAVGVESTTLQQSNMAVDRTISNTFTAESAEPSAHQVHQQVINRANSNSSVISRRSSIGHNNIQPQVPADVSLYDTTITEDVSEPVNAQVLQASPLQTSPSRLQSQLKSQSGEISNQWESNSVLDKEKENNLQRNNSSLFTSQQQKLSDAISLHRQNSAQVISQPLVAGRIVSARNSSSPADTGDANQERPMTMVANSDSGIQVTSSHSPDLNYRDQAPDVPTPQQNQTLVSSFQEQTSSSSYSQAGKPGPPVAGGNNSRPILPKFTDSPSPSLSNNVSNGTFQPAPMNGNHKVTFLSSKDAISLMYTTLNNKMNTQGANGILTSQVVNEIMANMMANPPKPMTIEQFQIYFNSIMKFIFQKYYNSAPGNFQSSHMNGPVIPGMHVSDQYQAQLRQPQKMTGFPESSQRDTLRPALANQLQHPSFSEGGWNNNINVQGNGQMQDTRYSPSIFSRLSSRMPPSMTPIATPTPVAQPLEPNAPVAPPLNPVLEKPVVGLLGIAVQPSAIVSASKSNHSRSNSIGSIASSRPSLHFNSPIQTHVSQVPGGNQALVTNGSGHAEIQAGSKNPDTPSGSKRAFEVIDLTSSDDEERASKR